MPVISIFKNETQVGDDGFKTVFSYFRLSNGRIIRHRYKAEADYNVAVRQASDTTEINQKLKEVELSSIKQRVISGENPATMPLNEVSRSQAVVRLFKEIWNSSGNDKAKLSKAFDFYTDERIASFLGIPLIKVNEVRSSVSRAKDAASKLAVETPGKHQFPDLKGT